MSSIYDAYAFASLEDAWLSPPEWTDEDDDEWEDDEDDEFYCMADLLYEAQF